jgi:hypothetical protein
VKRFEPNAELCKTDVAGIANLHPWLEMSYDKYDAADESNDLSGLGSAEGKYPISLKQAEFSLKQYAKRMGQANFCTFDKWKKGWVVGYLEKRHGSIIWGQNCLKHVGDGPLHCERVDIDFLVTFENLLPLDNVNTAEWILRPWVEIFLKKCVSEI